MVTQFVAEGRKNTDHVANQPHHSARGTKQPEEAR